jgi:hypothetical protein
MRLVKITIGLLLALFDRGTCYHKCDLNDPLLPNQLYRPDPGSDTSQFATNFVLEVVEKCVRVWVVGSVVGSGTSE